jgi:hypothetical protein
MTIDSRGSYLSINPNGGNVGVGTSSPAAKFVISNAGAEGLEFIPADSSNYNRIQSYSRSGGVYNTLETRASTHIWAIDATERMRITSGGNVEISNSLTVASDLNLTRSAVTPAITFLSAIRIVDNNTGFGYSISAPSNSTMRVTGDLNVTGALSKGSGSFRIKHPLLSKKSTHELVHSFIEGPQADLIYRGKIKLSAGKATINIDEVATMTEGTFEALCREVQCFTTNETGWDAVRGKVTGNILTIESQNTESTDEISWMVVGERQDEHMIDTSWTDENGKVIVEPLIPGENNII